MNEMDVGAIFIILGSLPFLYLALRGYIRGYRNGGGIK